MEKYLITKRHIVICMIMSIIYTITEIVFYIMYHRELTWSFLDFFICYILCAYIPGILAIIINALISHNLLKNKIVIIIIETLFYLFTIFWFWLFGILAWIGYDMQINGFYVQPS